MMLYSKESTSISEKDKKLPLLGLQVAANPPSSNYSKDSTITKDKSLLMESNSEIMISIMSEDISLESVNNPVFSLEVSVPTSDTTLVLMIGKFQEQQILPKQPNSFNKSNKDLVVT